MARHSQAYGRELVLSQIPTDPIDRGVPKLRLPFDIVRTGNKVCAATVEQGSADDLVQNVWVVLATDEGSRIELPDFGNPDQVFTDDYDLGLVRAALDRDEPRAVHIEDGQLAGLIEQIGVEVG
jgi:hypothetical protein